MKKISDDSENLLPNMDQPIQDEYNSKFWGKRGSGILLMSSDTKRILLMLRSPLVNEPGTWGIPGGKVDDGEELIYSALRELQEETGYSGLIDLFESFVFREDEFEYHNFIGLVSNEFEVQLNWESLDAKWFELDALPENLYFGVKLLLENSIEQLRNIAVTSNGH